MDQALNSNDDSDDTKTAPEPSKSIIFFIGITLLYLIFVIYNINSAGSLENVQASTNNSTFLLIYVLVLVMGSFFLNLTISKSFCEEQSIQYSNVFFITILPWLVVFGTLYFLLEIFPGWIRPFSNTIGYSVVNLLGVTSILNKLLDKANNNPTITSAINKIDQNTSKFINEFDINSTDFEGFIKKLKSEGITKSSALNLDNIGPDEIELFKLINIKHFVGKIMWYIMAGTLISSISFNYLINQKCKRTDLQNEEAIKDLYNEIDTDPDS